MAADAQFVAVRVAEIGSVIIRVIVHPQAGGAFVPAAIGQRRRVAGVHCRPVRREQGHHLPVAWRSGPAVESWADQQQRPRRIGGLPASPGFFGLVEAQPQAERPHHRRIKGKGARKICDPDVDMRQHGCFLAEWTTGGLHVPPCDEKGK